MAKNSKMRKPELLAPAGSLSTALIAFDCGADAVYVGLDKFNARERTENFTLEDLSKLLAYSKKNHKKVYVTFNTLIKESEIPTVAEYLLQIAKLSPDALIVQDIGVLRLIREYFPGIEIHASTQMGIHNSAGANFAAKLGVKRVILERAVTLEEINEINKNSKVQTEVFVHGALCCSMSGNCILSSWLGGWSGNRGKCKQSCRRRYFSESGNGFFLSTKDLCGIAEVPKLKEMGVSSLKIEGRLRKADYVRSVVTAYRMVLDAEPHEDIWKVVKKAREVLGGSLGRKWSTGFFYKEGFKEVIEHTRLGVSGQPCGFVKNTKKSGFSASITKRIHVGDRLRIQPKSGEEGPTFTVTKLFCDDLDVNKVTKGQECFVACDKDIPSDGMLYKIGESGGDCLSRIKNLPMQANAVNMQVTITDRKFLINVQTGDSFKTWSKGVNLAKAEKRALNEADIIEAFKASNSAEYCLGQSHVEIHGSYFLPASELKKIRREFWLWLEDNLSEFDVNEALYNSIEKFRVDYTKNSRPALSDDVSVQLDFNKNHTIGKRDIVVHTLDDFDNTTDEVILPTYCFEHQLHSVKRKIRKAITKGKKRFRVTSLYQFELLLPFKDVIVSTSYPLPIVNSLAATEVTRIIKRLKCTIGHAQAWVELEKAELDNLVSKSSVPIEIYNYGRVHLFVTRAYMAVKGQIQDGKGNEFYVVLDTDYGLAYIYSKKVLSLPKVEGTASYADYTFANKSGEETSEFNYNYALL